MNAIIYLRNLSKTKQNWLRSRRTIGKGMKILGNASAVASGGGGERRTPPPRNRKNCCKKWCYLPELYTFGEEAEITEKCREKL